MTLAETVLAVMFVGLTAYALFAGADFGAGVWDLVAGGTRKGRPQRDLIEHSLAPVWEANHVWLIFVLVVMWTGFPPAFAAVASTLYLPLTLAALGMIARGSAFAFRKTVPSPAVQRFFGAAFAFSSVVTPYFLGAVVGGIASGRVPPGIAAGDVVTGWVNPTSALGGVLAVGVCAYLAAVLLCADAVREGAPELAEGFRARGLGTAVGVGVVALAGVLVLRADAPELFAGLTHRGLPLMVVSGLAGLASIALLVRRRYGVARVAAGTAVAAVLWGWAAAQYPYILPPRLTIADAAAGRATQVTLLISLLVGALLLIPALIYLYTLFQRGRFRSAGAEPSAAGRRRTLPDVGSDGAEQRHRVVVVGGGFGGLSAARRLTRSPVDVTIVDRTNHHLFQPLLYQVATGILSEGLIAPALRSILKRQPNAHPLLGEVDGLDLADRSVSAVAPDGRAFTLRYDTLIVAGGVTHAYFGHDEWSAYAPGMKTLEDARRLRNHILGAFEMAELADDPATREAWLTFVIVGAGPTGVELAGQVAELAHHVLPRDYRDIDTRTTRIVLLDAAPTVLTPFPDKLRRYTRAALERMGVEVVVDTTAVDLDDDGITVRGPDGEHRISARTKIWAAGVQASPLAAVLAAATGAERDRAGRIAVLPDCSLPGRPEVFAVGDMVSLDGLPGVAQPAIQEGRFVATVIDARLRGRPAPDRFRYRDKGSMATIGRFRAVADAMRMRVTGMPAFLMWAFVHVLYLVGWGNRIGTLYRWTWSLVFTRNRPERLITVEQAHDEIVHDRRPGEAAPALGEAGLVPGGAGPMAEQATRSGR